MQTNLDYFNLCTAGAQIDFGKSMLQMLDNANAMKGFCRNSSVPFLHNTSIRQYFLK